MNDLEKYIIGHRRYLHAHPEVGFECFETHDYLREELNELGIKNYPHIGVNSIVGVIENGEGPVIGLRADFDALPIKEDTNLEFKSQNIGKMHACGHDAHTSMLLGTAKYLSEHLDEWSGTVKFIFQEAEEGPNPGGAFGIVQDGIIDDVEEFYGLHVSTSYDCGVIAYNESRVLASADTIRLKFIGKGAHAAYPHLGNDPIIMAANFISQVQTVISRKLNPMETGVITIAHVEAGTTHNVIPNDAFLEGTVRTYSEDVRQMIEKEVERLAKGIAYSHGGNYELEYIREYNPTINTLDESKYLSNIAKETLGEEKVLKLKEPSMGAEDFSRYIDFKKGAIAWLGVGFKDRYNYSLHHPKVEINEEALINGTKLFINIIKKRGEK